MPGLSISDVSTVEGNDGTTTFVFTVALSAAAGDGGVTFDIATADGTAQDASTSGEDADYVAQSLTGQAIPAGGSGPYSFSVTVNGDTDGRDRRDVLRQRHERRRRERRRRPGDRDDRRRRSSTVRSLVHADLPDPGQRHRPRRSPARSRREGVVVGDFEGTAAASGFYIQDATGDGNAATSDGIFVFTGSRRPRDRSATS